MPIYNRRYLDNKKDPDPMHLQRVGPRVPVEVHVPKALADALTKEGKAIPGCKAGFALVDTGASMMCVNRQIFQDLGVPPITDAVVSTPAGSQKQFVYPATLRFPNSTLPELDVYCLGSDLSGQGDTVALIGRDVLMRFVLVYNGPLATISLAH